MRYRVAAIAALALLAVSLPAHAQRGGGFRGGFGGDRGTNLMGLLQIEEVRKEVELLDDQQEAIGKLAEEQRGERPDFRALRELSDEERQQRIAQFREEAEKRAQELDKKLGEILLPHQRERLEQLAIQRQGIRALTNDEVAGKLKLTDQQKQKIETVMEQSRDKMRQQLRETFQSGDREAIREKMQEFQQQLENEVLAVLTTDQKDQFTQMKGEPFEFPRRQFGAGGRGPRGEAGSRGGRRGPRGEGRRRPQFDNQ